jgi:hypothetical protein
MRYSEATGYQIGTMGALGVVDLGRSMYDRAAINTLAPGSYAPIARTALLATKQQAAVNEPAIVAAVPVVPTVKVAKPVNAPAPAASKVSPAIIAGGVFALLAIGLVAYKVTR